MTPRWRKLSDDERSAVDEAKALMNSLPLGKNQLADFTFIGLTPLTPLRMLVETPAAPAGAAK